MHDMDRVGALTVLVTICALSFAIFTRSVSGFPLVWSALMIVIVMLEGIFGER